MKKTQRYLLLLLFCIFVVLFLLFFNPKTVTTDHDENSENSQNRLTYVGNLTSKPIEMKPNDQVAEIEKALLLGKVNASTNHLFEKVKSHHANKEGIYLLAEVYESFKKMYDAAQKDGIRLIVMSGFRDFDHQKRIWNNKWNGNQLIDNNRKATEIEDPLQRAKELLKYSAMPGSSRHHWGTDIDLNSFSNQYFDTGTGKQIYDWLQTNARDFGFFQPYIAFGPHRERGHMEERWHWTYLPLSSIYLHSYLKAISNDDLQGFEGDYLAGQIGIIQNFVLGINKELLENNSTQR